MFAADGFGDLSPGKSGPLAGLLTGLVLTASFLVVILRSTSSRAPVGFAPTAIGLPLTMIHLVFIPLPNTSVNPARSAGPALFAGGEYLAQLWLFWTAPITGAAIGGFLHRRLDGAADTG